MCYFVNSGQEGHLPPFHSCPLIICCEESWGRTAGVRKWDREHFHSIYFECFCIFSQQWADDNY